MKKFHRNRGITLFISVVIMSILLFVSFAAVNIAFKSSLFASSGKDSQYAFYAADAGMECAIFWDSKSDPSKFDVTTSGSPINCGGHSMSNGQTISGTTTVTTLIGGGGASNRTSKFGFVMDQGTNSVQYCAIVTVTKNADGSTYINSRGYNTCDTANPKRLERGIEVTY